MGDADLAARLLRARAAYNELGHEVIEVECARLVRNLDLPRVHDANLISRVWAETDAEIDAVLGRADEVFDGLRHRKVMLDTETPLAVEARLVLEGYEVHSHAELVLEGDLRATPSDVDIRPVRLEDDWRSLATLWRLDHEEEAAKGQHEPWAAAVTEQMVAAMRGKAPDLQFWIASVDGTDAGFFSAWPGTDGMGIVEDLFTRPEFRGRGIATALIAHCVDDARERGAGPVAISARTADTPKHMYAALGFRPTCVSRTYLKQ